MLILPASEAITHHIRNCTSAVQKKDKAGPAGPRPVSRTFTQVKPDISVVRIGCLAEDSFLFILRSHVMAVLIVFGIR
ncbi:hypothetical protein AB9R84_00875 [Oceanimonas smirnovii]|uniref:hypothetical protein n=1 Tax=Oceanimonas smirnovii TaxID=264574 RepID=UPI003AAF46D6